MGWIDEDGNEITNILLSNIDVVKSIQWCFFDIQLTKVTDIENSSILFYLENKHKSFDILDFIQWMFERNIYFKVKYRHYPNINIWQNIKAYLFILRLNIKRKVMEGLR